MQKQDPNEIIVGIDIGTTKISCLIASKDEFGKTVIHGIGKSPSHGVVRGEVANIDKTVNAIKSAVEQAQRQSGIEVQEVYVGIAGQHIKSHQHRGILTRDYSQTEITKKDVKKLILDMHKLAMNPGERIIHVLPQEFFVDSLQAASDPIGMCGNRLEANFHIITGRVSAAQNIERCIERAGFTMVGLMLEPIASSAAVLDEEEKEAGVALVDIGGGTTDLAIFQKGIIRHTCVIPFGGNIISEDIVEGCKITPKQAEALKTKFGTALAQGTKENQIISIPGLRGRPAKEISMKNLANIIQSRMEEIFEQVHYEIKTSGYLHKLNCGIVITGGGSQLNSIKQLVEYVTGMDAKIGFPIEHLAKGFDEQLKHPLFATGIGLVEKAFDDMNNPIHKKDKEEIVSEKRGEEEIISETKIEDEVILKAKNHPIKTWWKNIFQIIPEWLLDENDDDFKE